MRFVLFTVLMGLLPYSVLAEDEYLRLAIGDEWIMSAIIVAPSGQSIEGMFHRKTEGAVARNGTTYFRIHTWTEGLPFKIETTKLYRKDQKAVYSIDEDHEGEIEQIELVLPLKAGEQSQHNEGSKITTETVIGLEAVEGPGRSYDKCYHIRSSVSDGSMTEDYWESASVGSVKSILVFADTTKITLTLKEFKPGK